MEIDSGCSRCCSLEHEFKVPESRAERVTNARLTFIVNGIRFNDPKRQVIPVAVLCEPLQQRREVSSALQELWKKDVRRARWSVGVAMVRQEYQFLRHRLRKCGNPISGARNVGSGEESAGHSRANSCMKGAPFHQIHRDVIAGGSHSAPATKSVWLVRDWNASKFMGNDWNSIFLIKVPFAGLDAEKCCSLRGPK